MYLIGKKNCFLFLSFFPSCLVVSIYVNATPPYFIHIHSFIQEIVFVFVLFLHSITTVKEKCQFNSIQFNEHRFPFPSKTALVLSWHPRSIILDCLHIYTRSIKLNKPKQTNKFKLNSCKFEHRQGLFPNILYRSNSQFSFSSRPLPQGTSVARPAHSPRAYEPKFYESS